MFVKKRNGNIEQVQFDKITQRIDKLVNKNDKKFIDPVIVAQKVVASIFSGITTEELDLESAKIAINLCTTHHLYALLAGKILVSNLHKKTLNTFVEKEELIQQELGFLDQKWLDWIKNNKDELNNIVNYENDYIYDYFGFKTLERSYLIKNKNGIIERPQDMLMRVASFINQGDLNMTKKTYELMAKGYYTHASPTLFNSGNKRSQLSSCFLLGTSDSLDGITKTWADVSKISKWGGGIGLHVSNIRAKDSLIRGTNGPCSGIIPMLKVYNEIARYIDQCFVGTTKIYTENGLVSIENIKPLQKVFTIDGTLQNIKRVYCDSYKGTILNFTINHDYESIKVTPNHPFYVIINQESGIDFDIIINKLKKNIIIPEWINAKDITTNDLIGIPIPKYVKDNYEIDEADCYMYGLMLGNGHININEAEIILDYNKLYIIEFIIKYLKQNCIIYSENKTELQYKIKWIITSNFKFVKSQLYDINNNKYFDSIMLNLPENKVKYIIKGIIDTYGTINKEIILEMKSQNIIDSVKYILLRMGILCSGYKKNTLVLKIPKYNKITKLLNIEENETLQYFNYNDVLYTRIKEVTEEYIETNVYDLEIENNHNYLTQAGLVHNGGKRKGSIAIYLEPHHSDIMSFLDLRKNFGAETERARDLFLAIWISDLFMKQVDIDGDWYLMCPDNCPRLTDVYGLEYEKLYWSYVHENKFNKKIKAREIMKAILDSQLETGTPYIGFKDNINAKSNQKNIGVIKSSNLCVHEDTLILTDQGYKKIKLLENQEINIWNNENWSKVIVKKTGINKDLIRVNLSNGSYLDCTPEHKFYIIKDELQSELQSELQIEVQACKLKVNNKLIKLNLPKPINFIDSIELNYPYTHGIFCGDGTISDNYSKLYLHGEKKKLLKYINYESYIINNSCDRYDIILPKDLNYKFEVPFNASIIDRIRWFEGYCDINYSFVYNDSIQILSINKSLLINIRLMLHTLGIESIIKEYDALLIESVDIVKLIELGFSPKLLKINKPKINKSNYVKVLSIEESYKNVDTFCFTEYKTHMGVFNGILTGQCHEIVEYSDANEYAVCNLGSIAINKCIDEFIFNKDDEWIIYTKENCKYCNWSKTFLLNNSVIFKEITNQLPENTNTYPQIFYNKKHIGGFDKLYEFTKGIFNYNKLYDIAYIATINLNKVIDINYYPVIEAKKSNLKHRPIGLGIQGLADALVLMKIPFDSEESLNFNSKMMETIYLAAVTASIDESKNRYNILKDYINEIEINKIPEYYDESYYIENKNINNIYHKLKLNKFELKNKIFGAYSTFEGSPISKGQFQFDLWSLDRNKLKYYDKWIQLTEEVKKYGIRNSLLTALMPTASTSQILGNNECFEFFTNNIYSRRTLAGDFPLVNKYLIDDLYKLGLWSNDMKQLILANNGSISNFNNIPEQIKSLYKTIWEIKQVWVLKNAIARGPFNDQTQSMNIFMQVPDYQKLYSSHFYAWKNGLKTGMYYLRTKPAKEAVKVTIDPNIHKKLEQITTNNYEVCENCSA
jgi:ribonucleoside-diphosphate reductase alpha chain